MAGRQKTLVREAELRDSAIRLRQRGFTYTEIAQQLGITRKQAVAKARGVTDKLREVSDE